MRVCMYMHVIHMSACNYSYMYVGQHAYMYTSHDTDGIVNGTILFVTLRYLK